MRILAVDPGPHQSAYVALDADGVRGFGIQENNSLLRDLDKYSADVLVIEQVAAMGMAVGAEVFETVFWSGRFVQAWGGKWDRVKRHEVKIHLCGSMRAKDANIRAALLDRFGPGKELAVGTKKAPGPLHGISSHCWAALAVAVTWWDTKAERTKAAV